MTRKSKQSRHRAISPRKHRNPSPKTGPLKDALELGYKPHENAIDGPLAATKYIAKVK